jgi:hypothetical protein
MDPKLTVAFAVIVLAAGHWMVAAGVAKRVLTWRRPNRRCPSCGRLRRDCSCVR